MRHIIGPVTGVAVGLAFVLPRSAWIMLAILSTLLVLARSERPRSIGDVLSPGPLTLAFTLFCAWAALSTSWSIQPTDGAIKAVWLLLIVLFAHAGARSIEALDDDAANAFGIGLVIAMVVMGGLLAFEIWSSKALLRALADVFTSLQRPGKHMVVRGGEVVAISDAEINRRVCVFMLLLVSSLVAARNLVGGGAGKALAVVLAIEAAMIAVATEHQSSQLALLAGGAVLALHFVSPRASLVVVACGWIVATLLVVPIVAAAYGMGLSRDERLPFSFRERVSLWGWQAEQVRLRPLLGAGANTTPAVDFEMIKTSEATIVNDRLGAHHPGRHAHNYYLQTWYELGAIGGLLLLAAGFAGLRLVSRLAPPERWPALTQFAITAAMVATSYGLWQIWVQGTIAAAFMILAAARRPLSGTIRPAVSDPHPN